MAYNIEVFKVVHCDFNYCLNLVHRQFFASFSAVVNSARMTCVIFTVLIDDVGLFQGIMRCFCWHLCEIYEVLNGLFSFVWLRTADQTSFCFHLNMAIL